MNITIFMLPGDLLQSCILASNFFNILHQTNSILDSPLYYIKFFWNKRCFNKRIGLVTQHGCCFIASVYQYDSCCNAMKITLTIMLRNSFKTK